MQIFHTTGISLNIGELVVKNHRYSTFSFALIISSIFGGVGLVINELDDLINHRSEPCGYVIEASETRLLFGMQSCDPPKEQVSKANKKELPENATHDQFDIEK